MLIYIAVVIAMGYWGYKIAEKQGRNTTLAAILCGAFGLIAIIGYYIAGDKY